MEISEARTIPESVALVALGNSKNDYIVEATRAGSRYGVADETWTVNKIGNILESDLIFRMDDLRKVQKVNLKVIQDKDGVQIHDRFDKVLREQKTPIITSKAYPEYPSSIDYPLEKVINHIGYSYFATTPAYAVAYASLIGVKHMCIYGCDYNYYYNPGIAEQGRGNLEFVMAIAMSKGMRVSVAPNSSLLDNNLPIEQQFYGYANILEVRESEDPKKSYDVVMRPDIDEMRLATLDISELEAYKTLIDKYGQLSLGQLDAAIEERGTRRSEIEDETGQRMIMRSGKD